ncbi:MAG: hypothetical protein IJ794_16465 [Lachnospiraceae bacterium]|nr:hypothetical protein [Lachnospiraceae bacterium]
MGIYHNPGSMRFQMTLNSEKWSPDKMEQVDNRKFEVVTGEWKGVKK